MEQNAVFGYYVPKDNRYVRIRPREFEAGRRLVLEARPTKSITFDKLLKHYTECPKSFGGGLSALLAHFAALPNGADQFGEMLAAAQEKERDQDEEDRYWKARIDDLE